MRPVPTMVIGAPALLIIGAAMAQPPVATAPGISSNALGLQEAAVRAVELCINHMLGEKLIGPATLEQLEKEGFPMSAGPADPSGNPHTIIYSSRALTTEGVVGLTVYRAWSCHIYVGQEGRGYQIAMDPIEDAIATLVEKPSSFLFAATTDVINPTTKRKMYSIRRWLWKRPVQDLAVAIDSLGDRLQIRVYAYGGPHP